MQVNGEYAILDVTKFTEHPYEIRVGVYAGVEDGEPYRQVTVSDSEGAWEVLLSLEEARALRDHVAEAIVLAMNASERPRTKAAPPC